MIVGASLAGLRAAETLRNGGFTGRVRVVGAEPHRPYDRPPLSKKLLSGEWEPDRVELRKAEAFDELDVEWLFGTAASGLDVGAGVVHLDGGDSVPFDGLVIATGASPRRIPEQGRFDHVHELRTLDDSMRLRARLATGGRRVAVIGAGFIGLEVASTARRLGNEVVVLEGLSSPLVRGLGEEMGGVIADLHAAEGVEVRCDVVVDHLDHEGVVLGSGEVVSADVVVVGIGVVPNDHWLAGSGIELRDGVVCDAMLAARTTDGSVAELVFAAGDVARWMNPLFGEEMRVEHWTNAAEQGAQAATNLLASAAGEPGQAYAPVPFFWSDQFDHRIQFLGRAGPDDDVEVVLGGPDEAKLLALYGRDGRVRGALGVNAPRWVMPMRQPLMDRMSWDDAVARARELAT